MGFFCLMFVCKKYGRKSLRKGDLLRSNEILLDVVKCFLGFVAETDTNLVMNL